MTGFNSSVNAQQIDVGLSVNGNLEEFSATKKIIDTTIYEDIPFHKFNKWSLRITSYNAMQAIYEHVLEGKSTMAGYKAFVARYRADTSFVLKKKIPRNNIYILTGIDAEGKKHVIVDANNNRNFDDDKEYLFDLNSDEKLYPIIPIRIDYFDGQQLRGTTVEMKLDPYRAFFVDAEYSVDNPKILDVCLIKLLPVLKGEIQLGNKTYSLAVLGYDSLYKGSKYNVQVTVSGSSYRYSSTDTIDLGARRYKIGKFGANHLEMKFVGVKASSGAEVNTIAPSFDGFDLLSGKEIKLDNFKGKYTLIDFWGSWCAPCIALIPELKKAYAEYKSKVNFISIAFDKESDKAKLISIIKENKMTWNHLFDRRDGKEKSLAELYKVQEFPTTLLIDPSGKVVARSVAAKGLKEILTYLSEHNGKMNQ
ncbi:TlpA disulfide reductase family protein [Pedobacter sp. UYP30]|uniref:TlpA family protein disulfide reductase n=1 Tax=Pedobacter sp. UYP30 TaxID=1756400 RepID=UPI0033978BFD